MPKNIYKNSKGEVLPGVTTICNQLDKPQLIDWAWKLGQEGKDWRDERDNAGDIGTLVHKVIFAEINDKPWSIDTQPQDVITKVNLCLDKYLDWVLNQPFSPLPILAEIPLVSEKLKFGGQPDFYGRIGKKRVLLDIKTSGGIYDSYWLQLAGYDILLRENGYKVDEYQILWLPKDDRFACPIRTDLRKEKQIFRNLLKIYYLRREL